MTFFHLAESDPELKNNIRNVVVDYPFYITPKCKDLLVKMLRVDAKERLTIDEVTTPTLTTARSYPTVGSSTTIRTNKSETKDGTKDGAIFNTSIQSSITSSLLDTCKIISFTPICYHFG